MRSEDTSNNKKLFNFERLALFLLALSIACIATYLAVTGNTAGAATCYVAGMLFLVFSNIDRFTSFKGLGFEANIRELGDKIKEADAVLKQIKSLSTFASRAVVDLTNRTGRLGGYIGSKERFRYAQEISEHLDEMGVAKAEIREVLKSWIYYSTFDLMNYLIRGHHDGLPGILKSAESYRQALQNEFSENYAINDPIQASRRIEIQPKLDKIDSWLNECKAITSNKSEFSPDAIRQLIENVYWLVESEKAELVNRAKPITKEIASIQEDLKYYDLEAWSRLEYKD